jgi:hypothetical protein
MKLLTCLDDEQYPEAINNWAAHKASPLIRCGMNQSFSGIPEDIRKEIDSITNATEQTHLKGNSLGRWLSLLRAIDM